MLDIFRQKTAPAFEVALRVGARSPAAHPRLDEVLAGYSEALGIAYQIRDDLDDLAADGAASDGAVRPSLPLALAFERWHSNEALRAHAAPGAGPERSPARSPTLRLSGAEERCRALLEAYKEQAIRSLPASRSQPEGLLRRVVGKIFSESKSRAGAVSLRLEMLQVAQAGAEAAR